MIHSDAIDLSDINGPFVGSHAVSEGWLTRRQLSSAQFTRLFHNAYVPAGFAITHELRSRAAAAIAPPTATLTGASAAAVYGFDFAGARDPVEFVVDEQDRFTAQRGMDIRRCTLGPAEGRPWHGIQLATPSRMTLDLLSNTKLRRSLPRAVGLLDAVLRAGAVDLDELSTYFDDRHDRGIVRARRAVELADARSESVRESEVRVWLTLRGITPTVQLNVYDADGRFLGRLDLAVEEQLVAIEYDGKQAHATIEQRRHDAERRRRMEKLGWLFIVVDNDWLSSDPQGVANAVHDAVRSRS